MARVVPSLTPPRGARPAHPYHAKFNPGWAVSLGYDNLKVIEACKFFESVASGVPAEPGFAAAAKAAKAARVQQAIMQSWDSGQWEAVQQSLNA